MAMAFVLDQAAQNYLQQFPAFPGIATSFTGAIHLFPIDPQHTLKELIHGIIAAQGERDVLVDTHSQPGSYANIGLQMKIHGRSARGCNKNSLRVLMAFHELDAQVAAAGTSGLAALPTFILQQRTSLADLINIWSETAPDYPSTPDGHIARWQRDMATYLFERTGSPQEQLTWTREVTSQIDPLRAMNIALHFRSCHLGADHIVMEGFLRFFGARSVTAPSVRTNFSGPFLTQPARHIGPANVQQLANQRNVVTFGSQPNRVLVRTTYQGHNHTTLMVADSFPAVAAWTRQHLSASSTYTTGNLYLHFLHTDPPAYPLDRDYRSHIVIVRPTTSSFP